MDLGGNGMSVPLGDGSNLGVDGGLMEGNGFCLTCWLFSHL